MIVIFQTHIATLQFLVISMTEKKKKSKNSSTIGQSESNSSQIPSNM